MTETTLAGGPPLAALLDAMGRELSSLGAMADRVQAALSPALSSQLLSHPGVLVGLQDLDRLAQSARALGAVADRLSASVTIEGPLDTDGVLAALPLADLAARLGRPQAGHDAGPSVRHDEGLDDDFTIPSASAA